MAQIRAYILSVTAAAVLCVCIQSLAGKDGRFSSLIRLMTGVVMCAVVIAPLREFPQVNLTGYLRQLQRDASAAVEAGTASAKAQAAGRITQSAEAYILDKAASLSLNLTVELELAPNLLPSGVTITGNASPYARKVMETMITDELGIPEEGLKWN